MSYGLSYESQIDIVVIRCDSYIYLALCQSTKLLYIHFTIDPISGPKRVIGSQICGPGGFETASCKRSSSDHHLISYLYSSSLSFVNSLFHIKLSESPTFQFTVTNLRSIAICLTCICEIQYCDLILIQRN